MRRWLTISMTVLVSLALSLPAVAQVTQTATAIARPIQPAIYDYWTTSGNTSIDLDVPPGFFGTGSDPLSVTVELTGQPFGPGGGQGLPAAADTSVRRNKDPQFSGVGDTDTVSIRMKGLSLASIAPVIVTYFGGQNPEQWNVHVGLSSEVNQPWGTLTATKTYSGGGTFDSQLTVVPKFTFTRVSGGGSYVLDVGNPSWGIPASQITAVSTSWITQLPGASGGFHPGYSQGPTPEDIYYVTEYSNNCAEHESEPCGEECPDDGGPVVEPEPVEEETTSIAH